MISTILFALIVISITLIGVILYGIFAPLASMGNDIEGKRKAFHKTQGNVFIVVGIALIIVAGVTNILSKDVFLIFFTAGLTSLGFKLSLDYKDKFSNKD